MFSSCFLYQLYALKSIFLDFYVCGGLIFSKQKVLPLLTRIKRKGHMLRLEEIQKIYKTSTMKVEALKGVSLAFRKCEFVSVLGPSGCGKTTLLNIIGGLDHYDFGDLFILGSSTKGFKDHDWDVYRNHRIGFVFQSYNLIPQENIQQNVELGLAISGLKRAEREKRAREALDKVGLAGMYKKRPNELSGGQCQRVAIARAIVNNPDIILADEPTGALDSVTSLQIMDILKELSKERLIIMVTHNPDIAEKYSTRIINLLDGLVVGDSNPYNAEDEMKEYSEPSGKETKSHLSKDKAEEKAKMNWLTTFSLSGKNLLAKFKRTSMIVVASSIGIIGISAVLAVSAGVTGYINSMQDDMLSGSPIKVAKSSFDISTLAENMSGVDRANIVSKNIKDGVIDVNSMVEQLVKASDSITSTMITNNITQDYIDFIDDMPEKYYLAVSKDYDLDILNNIFTEDTLEGRMDDPANPSDTWYSLSSLVSYATAILSKTNYSMFSSQISSYTSVVGQGLDAEDYVLSQYDILDGSFPKEENEVMIVLDHDYRITDFVLTLLGYYTQKDLMDTIYYYSDSTDSPFFSQENFDRIQTVTFEQLRSKTFWYFPNDTIYQETTSMVSPFTYSYQPDFDTWQGGIELRVAGILAPKKSVRYGCLDAGFYYTPKLSERFIFDNYNSKLARGIATIIENYKQLGFDIDSYTSSVSYNTDTETGVVTVDKRGITYDLDCSYEGEAFQMSFPVGVSLSSLASIISMFSGNPASSTTSASLTLNNVGGSKIPTDIEIYPTSFDRKFEVTNYLDLWNQDGDLTLSNGRVIAKESRDEIKYVDNLELIISIINTVITAVTIALVVFTSLSLVVSTVMISIITYVSVIERIKEIGVIRSLGGRKRDVSHLFNAETLIIGFLSGIFGVAVTYLLEVIINAILMLNFGLAIMNFVPTTALIIIGVAILLTIIAGLVPAASAARKDPVVALRTE